MKTLISALLILCTFNAKSQCLDIFGHKVDCPTMDDSLVIYNNSVKVYNYYKAANGYKELDVKELTSNYEKKELFVDMQTKRAEYKALLAQRNAYNYSHGLLSEKATFEDYYAVVDDYRFFQREFEFNIINFAAPFPLYDSRIAPIVIRNYVNSSDGENKNDEVNLPMYIPVVIKPDILLTDSERIVRKKILDAIEANEAKSQTRERIKNALIKKDTVAIAVAPPVVPSPPVKPISNDPGISIINSPKKSSTKKSVSKKQKVETPAVPPTVPIQIAQTAPVISVPAVASAPMPTPGSTIYVGMPTYTSDPNFISACLIGFMNGRMFQKIRPEDYDLYAIPRWGRAILDDNAGLIKLLKLRYGAYLIGIY